MNGRLRHGLTWNGMALLAVLLASVFRCFAQEADSNRLSLAELRQGIVERGRTIESFEAGGVVCAVVRERNAVVLQDASATAWLEIPVLKETFAVGEWLEIRGDHCALTRGRFGIQLATAPAVDNNGAHAALLKSGSVFLKAGASPIRLLWFNRERPPVLNVEYEGPGIPRQRIPAAALRHRASQQELTPGVRYATYRGSDWYVIPDFAQMTPTTQGIISDFGTPPTVQKAALVSCSMDSSTCRERAFTRSTLNRQTGAGSSSAIQAKVVMWLPQGGGEFPHC